MNGIEPCILSIDIGTSSMKGGIISLTGKLLSFGRVPLADTGRNDFLDWDSFIWNRALEELVNRLAGDKALKLYNIKGVVISGNGPTLVPVAPDGRPAGTAHLWVDKRELRIPGESSFFLPIAAWIKENNPSVYEKTKVFLGCPEYVSFLLTDNYAGFTTTAAFDPYIWTNRGIENYGLDGDKFPGLLRIGEAMGTVSSKGSAISGIPSGIPVFAGGSDFIMAILGTASVFPGRTCDRAGTSEGINYCSPVAVENSRIRNLPHVIENLFNAAGILSSTGAIFEWFRRISGQKDKEYSLMLEEIRDVGHLTPIPGFYPSLHRGAVWEFSGGLFIGLEADHGPEEMGRAVTNAIAYGVRDLIETLEANNCRIESLRVSGGQGRSSIWNQMKADITGKIVEIPSVIDTELMGNSCAGFTSAGFFNTLQESAESLVKITKIHFPDKTEHEKYTEGYNSYHQRCADIVKMMSMEKK